MRVAVHEENLTVYMGNFVRDMGAFTQASTTVFGDQPGLYLNPIGRIFCSASTCIGTPATRLQVVGVGLAAQALEWRVRAVARQLQPSPARHENTVQPDLRSPHLRRA